MGDQKLTDAELKFAEIIWANAPLKSSELVRLCEAALKWKKSTTYTMLKRLDEKGICRNEAGLVLSPKPSKALCQDLLQHLPEARS